MRRSGSDRFARRRDERDNTRVGRQRYFYAGYARKSVASIEGGIGMDHFQYHRPADMKEAIDLYANSDDPMYLGGGMTLIPTMKQRLAEPTDVIDLSECEIGARLAARLQIVILRQIIRRL
jgi:hypothetical protein